MGKELFNDMVRHKMLMKEKEADCPSCKSLRAENKLLRDRLNIRIDTVDGIPTGSGEDEIDRLQAELSKSHG